MAVVSTILVAGIIGDRLMNPSQGKLFVFYGNPGEATRILLGVGMIPLLLLAARFADEALTFRRVLAPGGMAILLAISFPIGGDIYNSLIVALVVALFLFISRSLNTRTIGLGALVICLLALSLISSDALRERFLVEAPDRLPWLETSDYYPAWTGGIKTGFLEPIFGVGASQYYHHCKSLQLSGNLDILGVDKCSWHPHNVFIQVFAETGIIGLILYVINISSIILTTIHNWKSTPSHQKSLAAIAVSSVFLFFWPFSTYSGAFAQHMNTITWFLIGASLGLSALTTQHSDLKSKLYKLPIINIKNSR